MVEVMMKRWTVADVMRRDVVSVRPETGFRDVADLLVTHAISAAPVVNAIGRVIGVISEADLLGKVEYADRVPHHPLGARRVRDGRPRPAGDTVADLMTSPAITIRADATVSGAARLMDAGRVKRLPVVDADGILIGVVARRDLVRLYTRADADVAATVRDTVREVGVPDGQLTVTVARGVVALRGRVPRHTAALLVALTTSIPGVVEVDDDLDVIADNAPRFADSPAR
jgi:CBS domain-containing protein